LQLTAIELNDVQFLHKCVNKKQESLKKIKYKLPNLKTELLLII